MDIKKKIKNLSDSLAPELIAIRRHLHQYPELSFEETNTSKYIQNLLSEWGIKYTSGWAIHGIVGSIKGEQSKSNKTICLRADIDALPIKETNKKSYKSKNEGVMHACGHDVHTTCLLGAIKILNETKKEWSGLVKFVFQPGEEKLPGGASIILKENALGKRLPQKMLGQHVHPPLEVGKVGFRSGQYMASADEIELQIIGKGGHGALPLNFIDPVFISAKVIDALQAVISRYSDPKVPSVLSFGKIYSDGGATNVIPKKVTIEGTLRSMDEENRTRLHKRIIHIAQHTAKAFGGKCKVDLRIGYPSLYNDPKLTDTAKQIAIDYLGKDNVVDLPIRLTAEDFAYYSQKMPACFYRLGTGNVIKGITSSVHTPTFDVDEDSIALGTGLMAYLAINTLSK